MSKPMFGAEGWKPTRLGSRAGETFIITGANSGTGFEAARILLTKGASVVMLNRNADKSKAAIDTLKQELGNDIDVKFIKMDLGSLDSVRKAAADVLDQVPRINALICNAAIAQIPTQQMTDDGFESMLGVNHYGHFLLCGLLFDRLEASSARIVVVASAGYKWCKAIQFDDLNYDRNYDAMQTYCHSKLAQMMFAYELQRRIKAAGKSVQVYVCHPGASRTQLLSDASLFNKVMWWFMSWFAQSAAEGAYPSLMCATEDGLKPQALYGPTSRWDTVGPVGECALEPHPLDVDGAKKLWSVTEQKVGYVWKF